jgi:hypothetical protein
VGTGIILVKRISGLPQVVWSGRNIAGTKDDIHYIKKPDKKIRESEFGIQY